MATAARVVRKLDVADTLLYADTVEWCKSNQFREYLALGTYQLNENTDFRNGGIRIYKLVKGLKNVTLQYITEIKSTGVLDMKWSTDNTGTDQLLFSANAENCVKANSVDLSSNMNIQCQQTISLSDNDDTSVICLSIDLFDNERLVVSDSQGRITLIDINETNVVRQWTGHSHEAWIAAFDVQCNHVIISGGDDCKLCLWDTRQKDPMCYSNCKRHQMGVCSIQSHPTRSYVFASGSYDETVTLWDQRNFSTPLNQISSIGGGVWRLKWHPCFSNVMGLASMHAGFHVIDWEESQVIAQYISDPVSLGYGIDWFPVTEEDNDSSVQWLLASCSFYDHSLHLWTCD